MHSESPDDRVLICTHATLRFAFEQLADSDFNDVLLAIDEFHHVSQDDNSVLGNALKHISQFNSSCSGYDRILLPWRFCPYFGT